MVNYILKFFKYEWNMKDQSKYDPAFLYLKHLQTINSSLLIITEQHGEIFCEWLNWICKLCEIDWQKYFWKPVIFSNFFKHFIIELARGN